MAAIEQRNIQIKNGSSWYKVNPFPVGYIYLSYTNSSPATTYGGTWTAITGRFLYCNNGTGTGGASTHYHWMPLGKENGLPGLSATSINGWIDGYKYQLRASPNVAHSNYVEDAFYGAEVTGVNATETSTYTTSSLPPYQTVYAWRRTA